MRRYAGALRLATAKSLFAVKVEDGSIASAKGRDLLATAADDEDVEALKIIAAWHGEDGHIPAQLAVWRLIAARAEARGQPALLRDARRMIRALVILVGPADPAAWPTDARGARATISALAKRGGA